MSTDSPRDQRPRIRLTEKVRAAGWAAKLGPADLAEALARLPQIAHPDLLVGISTSDDAGVFRVREDLAIVSTVDFFTPIVDDPWTYGAISAANSISDVYAMGGRPLTALNVVCFPQNDLPAEVLADILRGAAAKAAEAGVVIVGGHTVDDPELKFGMSVTGVIDPRRIVRNVGARPGDGLVLTKALGTGILMTALKRDRLSAPAYDAAAASMLSLNRAACEAMLAFDVHAATDVTGFGLLGHGHEMAAGSAVTIELEAAALPLLPELEMLVASGILTGGCRRNRDWLAGKAKVAPGTPEEFVEAAFDPQTSGGLLIALPEAEVAPLLDRLRAEGVAGAARVGRVVSRGGASVTLG